MTQNLIPDPRHLISAEARKRVGRPFAHQGHGPGRFDCVGLVLDVGVAAGVLDWSPADPRWAPFRGYGPEGDPALLRAGLDTFFVRIPSDAWGLGDILWFRVQGQPRHLGLVAGPRSLVHAHSVAGKVIESPFTPHVGAFVKAAWRYSGIRRQKTEN
jgi:cell wall-associated NlpC family hydrolase